LNEDRMPNYEEVDLMDYLKVVWKWKYLIIIGTVVCAAIAGMVSLSLPRVYETTEVIEIGRIRTTQEVEGIKTGGEELLADVNSVKSVMESEAFMNQVIQTLNLNESPKSLLERVKVQRVERTNILKVSVQANSPEEAVRIAKAMANLVINDHKDKFNKLMKLQNSYKEDLARDVKKMEEEIALRMDTLESISKDPGVNIPTVILLQQGLLEARNRLTALKGKLQSLEIGLTPFNSYNTRVVAEPVAPRSAISPKVRLNILISAVIGFMVFILLSFFLEYVQKYKKETEKKGQATF